MRTFGYFKLLGLNQTLYFSWLPPTLLEYGEGWEECFPATAIQIQLCYLELLMPAGALHHTWVRVRALCPHVVLVDAARGVVSLLLDDSASPDAP